MKKIVSLIMVIALALATPFSVFAQEDVGMKTEGLVQNVTEVVNVDGEVVITNTISKSNESASIETISHNPTLTILGENEITVNGTIIATIDVVETESAVNPEESIGGPQEEGGLVTMYGETPFFGTTSDYAYYGTYYKTLTLSNILMAIGVFTLTEFTLSAMNLKTTAERVASLTLAILPVAFQQSSALYYRENLYKHRTLPSLYWQSTYDWYYDSARTQYITSESVYACRS